MKARDTSGNRASTVPDQDSLYRASRLSKAWRVLRNSPLSLAGLAIVSVFLFLVAAAPVLAPYPEDATGRRVNFAEKLLPPTVTHLMGTDDLGRDVFSRVLYGSRLSLGLGFAIVAATAILGLVLGSIAGFYGGVADEVIMRIGDMLMSIPRLLLAIAIVVATGKSLPKLVIAISLPWWPWYARVIRGEVIRIREQGYVEAARSVGTSSWRILFMHVLPNLIGVMVVQASLQVGRAILAVAALGFLGLGVQPPLVEWGLMVSIGRTYMPNWWWMAIFPGAAIFLLGFGFNLLGDGLRDSLDPRTTLVR